MLRRFFLLVAFFILNTILAEDIHYLSTGEDPEVFVKNKIDSHDVSFATKITMPRRVSRKLVPPLTTPTGALWLLVYSRKTPAISDIVFVLCSLLLIIKTLLKPITYFVVNKTENHKTGNGILKELRSTQQTNEGLTEGNV